MKDHEDISADKSNFISKQVHIGTNSMFKGMNAFGIPLLHGCKHICFFTAANQLEMLISKIEQILLKEDSAVYNSLSHELAKVDLDSDKQNLANKTMCFERNSIG